MAPAGSVANVEGKVGCPPSVPLPQFIHRELKHIIVTLCHMFTLVVSYFNRCGRMVL